MSAQTFPIRVSPQWQARCPDCGWRGQTYISIQKADKQGALHNEVAHPETNPQPQVVGFDSSKDANA